MFYLGCFVLDVDVGEGMGTTLISQEQGVALGEVACIFSLPIYFDEASVAVLPFACGDTFGDNAAFGVSA